MNRRSFLTRFVAGLVVAAAAPHVFVPKLIKPAWPRCLPTNGLLTYQYDIRAILMENSLKDIQAEADSHFFEMLHASEAITQAVLARKHSGEVIGKHQQIRQTLPRLGKFESLSFPQIDLTLPRLKVRWTEEA